MFYTLSFHKLFFLQQKTCFRKIQNKTYFAAKWKWSGKYGTEAWWQAQNCCCTTAAQIDRKLITNLLETKNRGRFQNIQMDTVCPVPCTFWPILYISIWNKYLSTFTNFVHFCTSHLTRIWILLFVLSMFLHVGKSIHLTVGVGECEWFLQTQTTDKF